MSRPNLVVAGLALLLSCALLAEHGKLLLSDDFSTASPAWSGKVGNWEVVNGVAKVSEKPEDHHAAVRRHPLKYHNGAFEFSFRFDGAHTIALMLDEKGAHVCFLYVTPAGMYLQTGKLADGSGEPTKLAALDTPFAPGTWHTAVVEVNGRKLTAQVDGKTISGESARIDVDKVDFGFLVGGVYGSLDNVKVYELK